MQTHLFTYRHQGKLWSLEIKANDEDDAKDRLRRLAFASYKGVLVANVPAALSPLVPIAVSIPKRCSLNTAAIRG